MYAEKQLIDENMAARIIRAIEQERGEHIYTGDAVGAGPGDAAASLTTRLSPQQMKDLLTQREEMMRAGTVRDDGEQDVGVTDQWRSGRPFCAVSLLVP